MDIGTEYKLKDPKRIQWLLGSLKTQHQLLTLELAGSEGKERSMVVEVCSKTSTVLLDAAIDPAIHQKLSSGHEFCLTTSHDGVDVRAEALKVSNTQKDSKGALYELPFPDQLYYVQRRDFFRISLAGLFKVPVRFEADSSQPDSPFVSAESFLSNVSAKGCLVSVADKEGDLITCDELPVVINFEVPESDELVTVSALSRHSRYLNRSAIWLIGFEFQSPPPDVERNLERLVVKLQMAARQRSRLE